jgi:hypothetical protein
MPINNTSWTNNPWEDNPWEVGNGNSVLDEKPATQMQTDPKEETLKKGRIQFDKNIEITDVDPELKEEKKGCIFVNLFIVFYGKGIDAQGAANQALYLEAAMNEICHATIGPDGKNYRVRYTVSALYEDSDFNVKQQMDNNKYKGAMYDDRLGFIRVSLHYKGSPYNDDKPNNNAGNSRGIGNSVFVGKHHLSTTSLTHEIIAHFFFGRGNDNNPKSHLDTWAENPLPSGPPSIRMIAVKENPVIVGCPAIYCNTNGSFNKESRIVLAEDKIQLTKEQWGNKIYIKHGDPTNTFFEENGLMIKQGQPRK